MIIQSLTQLHRLPNPRFPQQSPTNQPSKTFFTSVTAIGGGRHCPQDLQTLKQHPVAAKPINQNPTKRAIENEGRAGPDEPVEELEGLLGIGGAEVGGGEGGGDGDDVAVVGWRGVAEAGEEGHGERGVVGEGGEEEEEGREREGFRRWVREEGGGGETGCGFEVVGEAEAW